MADKRRDEFPPAIREVLARRVGLRCSNPECGAPTSGPQVDPRKALNVGVGAHISAAAIGGPRFDPTLSREERQDVRNGIWLCQTCAKLVDNDPDRFTIALLRTWKLDAEAAALRVVGQATGRRSGSLNTSPVGVIWTVPFPRNPFFTGRDSLLQEIRERLTADGKIGVVQAVSGLGGIGKTQVAVEFAYRHRSSYELVFWMTANSREQLQGDALLHARLLNLPGAESQDPEVPISAWRNWLNTHDNWLLIVDNADDPRLAQSFIPTNPGGHCIVTSRRSSLESLGVRDSIILEVMALESAVEFMNVRSGRRSLTNAEQVAVEELSTELGFLPLALEQAAAYVAETGCSFTDYLASYRNRRLALLEEVPPVAGTYGRTVMSTWSISFDELEATAPASADLLRVAAFAAPDFVPDELLLLGARELGDAIAAKLNEVARDPLLLEEVYRPLTRYGLAIRDGGSRSFTIHRLVQAVVRSRMPVADQARWARRTARALNSAFPPASYDQWPLCDRLLPHAKCVAEYAAEFELGFIDVGTLLNEAAAFLRLRADFDGSMRMHSQSLALRQRELPANSVEIAGSLNDTACLYLDLYRLADAEDLFDQALRVGRLSDSPDGDESVIVYLNNAGLTKARVGKCEEAELLLREAAARAADPATTERFVYAVVLNSMAELQLRQGKLDEALANAESALAIRQEVGNPEKIARTYFTLGEIERRRGNTHRAKAVFESGVSLKRQVHGTNHPDLIPILTRYARLALEMSDGVLAAQLASEAKQIRERFHLPEYLDNDCESAGVTSAE